MDYDSCNHKKLNQFTAEARRWKTGDKPQNEAAPKRGSKVQPAKRKKKGK